MRRTDGCINCGEVREIAAHGLCFTCYRQRERADRISVDRHNPGVRREHRKLFRGFAAVMSGLSDLGVSKTDVLAIRRLLEAYLAPIFEFLAGAQQSGPFARAVNGEQNQELVHRSRAAKP